MSTISITVTDSANFEPLDIKDPESGASEKLFSKVLNFGAD